MIKQIVKQLWSLRKSNIWIWLEVFVVFIFLWYVTDYFAVLSLNERIPTGYDLKDTYRVTLGIYQPGESSYQPEEGKEGAPARNFLRLVERLKQHPSIEAVSWGNWDYPYSSTRWMNTITMDSTLSLNPLTKYTTADYFRVFRISGANGETPRELAELFQSRRGLIISKETEQGLFRGSSGLHRNVPIGQDSLPVLAITTPLKQFHHSRPEPFLHQPVKSGFYEADETEVGKYSICFRAHPQQSDRDFAHAFREEMRNELQAGNFYLIDITPFSEIKAHSRHFQPIDRGIKIRSAFTLFFLLNLFLGIVATFWLRIKKRRAEIGLRIALGSSRQLILKQLIWESLVLTLLAVIPAWMICIHIYNLDLISTEWMGKDLSRFLLTTGISLGLMIIIVVLATWYPARRSSQIEPAEALHYE